jgi:hypothetical protein
MRRDEWPSASRRLQLAGQAQCKPSSKRKKRLWVMWSAPRVQVAAVKMTSPSYDYERVPCMHGAQSCVSVQILAAMPKPAQELGS